MVQRRTVAVVWAFLGGPAWVAACGDSNFSSSDSPGSDAGSDTASAGDTIAIPSDSGSEAEAAPDFLPKCPPVSATQGVDTFGAYTQPNGNFVWSNCFNEPFAEGPHVILTREPDAFSGDWDKTGIDYPGVYDPATATFRLVRPTDAGGDLAFVFGGAGGRTLPVAGDWNGDGFDTVGFYDIPTSTFFLNDTNSSGGVTNAFLFGAAKDAGADLVPIIGDWDGDGKSSVGVYDPDLGKFYLRNTNSPGAADATFVFGQPHLVPLAGDWDGDRRSGVGTYDPVTGLVELENVAGAAAADYRFSLQPGLNLVVGDWDGK